MLASQANTKNQSCFSFFSEAFSTLGFYVVDEKKENEAIFPNFLVDKAEKIEKKTNKGPLKFIDTEEYKEYDTCALKVEG
jgi:hypothetical protein